MAGGPQLEISVGRKDSKACPPSGRVPDSAKGAEAVKKAFARAGLSATEVGWVGWLLLLSRLGALAPWCFGAIL